jgi:serine/threonine-protein kinase
LETRVRLVAQAAEGLHAAHRVGLLHGDVKPSNVLVEETPDGDLRAWIGDFGIAVELAERKEPAALSGTPRFMAPELHRAAVTGDLDGIDRRADVFSLGVTLLEVLTGEPTPPPGIGSDGG